jgi:hypothetical protein
VLVAVGEAVRVAVCVVVPVAVGVALLVGVLVTSGVAVLVGVWLGGWVGLPLLPQALMKRAVMPSKNTVEK